MSKKSGCSKSYLWEFEKTGFKNPGVSNLIKVALALDTTIDYLVNEDIDISKSHDRIFFKKYLKMSRADKYKIRKIAEIIDDTHDQR